MRKIFAKEKLKIVVAPVAHKTDFLDVEMNLTTREFKPYRKPNDQPVYINAKSNHPKAIIKQLPKMIEQRISQLSSTEKIFENEKGFYEKALHNSGHTYKMQYVPNKMKKNRNRSRKVMYFNPPFSKSVKTKIGQLFLKLVDDFFPHNHILHQHFNRSTIKISYCTMSNVKDHIAKHNAKISNSMKNNDDNNKKTCNCARKYKGKCPLDGNCLQGPVVYQAHVTTNKKTMVYTGMAKNTFKERWYKHNSTIEKRPSKENVTTLSDYVWKLKDQNTPFNIKWSIKSRAYAFSSGSRKCDLCISEKLTILLANQRYSLNQRSELLAKCIHKRPFCLINYCENSPIT